MDNVKIDRSFVRDCPDNDSDCRLVEAIVHMAHSLNLTVTAEGVETEQQQHFLQQLGCDYLQGYHFSHPIPVYRFNDLINSTEGRLNELEKPLEAAELLPLRANDTTFRRH